MGQEAAALAATEVAFMLQAGQRRALQFTIAPGPAVTPHQEPLQWYGVDNCGKILHWCSRKLGIGNLSVLFNLLLAERKLEGYVLLFCEVVSLIGSSMTLSHIFNLKFFLLWISSHFSHYVCTCNSDLTAATVMLLEKLVLLELFPHVIKNANNPGY